MMIYGWGRWYLVETSVQVVALDGKKLRRNQDWPHQRDGIWMVSAWAIEMLEVSMQKGLICKGPCR